MPYFYRLALYIQKRHPKRIHPKHKTLHAVFLTFSMSFKNFFAPGHCGLYSITLLRSNSLACWSSSLFLHSKASSSFLSMDCVFQTSLRNAVQAISAVIDRCKRHRIAEWMEVRLTWKEETKNPFRDTFKLHNVCMYVRI
jgi:hypothetical protein